NSRSDADAQRLERPIASESHGGRPTVRLRPAPLTGQKLASQRRGGWVIARADEFFQICVIAFRESDLVRRDGRFLERAAQHHCGPRVQELLDELPATLLDEDRVADGSPRRDLTAAGRP